MLVIVEDWDVHETLEFFFHIETVGALDILEVDSTEGRGKISYRVDKGVWVWGIHAYIY
jgi:hypothetical protein